MNASICSCNSSTEVNDAPFSDLGHTRFSQSKRRHRRCSMQLGGLGLTFVVGADRIDVLSPQEECHGG